MNIVFSHSHSQLIFSEQKSDLRTVAIPHKQTCSQSSPQSQYLEHFMVEVILSGGHTLDEGCEGKK